MVSTPVVAETVPDVEGAPAEEPSTSSPSLVEEAVESEKDEVIEFNIEGHEEDIPVQEENMEVDFAGLMSSNLSQFQTSATCKQQSWRE